MAAISAAPAADAELASSCLAEPPREDHLVGVCNRRVFSEEAANIPGL